MKYLVTGGAGFIGTNLIKLLLAKGHRVTVFDNYSGGKQKKRIQKGARYINGDIRNLKQIKKASVGVDGIFHLAAWPRVVYSVKYPLETHINNVDGTLNVLIAARDNKIKRVIFSSSAAIYGNQKKQPMKEDFIPAPISPYGAHKLIGEFYCRLFSQLYGLETVCLRYFNVYGPYVDPMGDYALVVGKFLKQRKEGKPMTIRGDGRYGRDYIHVSDVAAANLSAMTAKNVGKGEIINIGSGIASTVNELAAFIGGATVKIPPQAGDPRCSQANINLAKKLLNWHPTVSFKEGINQMKAEWGIE